MNKYLNDLLIIDEEIGNFYYENEGMDNDTLMNKFNENNYVERALKIIKKMSSENVLELLKRCNYLTDFIDLKKFIKKYPLNKTYLKKNNNEYLEEYHKLRNTCYRISDIAINYHDFEEYMNILDISYVENYLLSNMSNEQLYTLSCETNIWDEKMYFFSYLKS